MNRVTLSVSILAGALSLWGGAARAVELTPVEREILFQHVSPERLQADTNGNKVHDNLEVKLLATRADRPVDVIVRYKQGWERAADRFAARISRRLPLDRSVATRLTRAEIVQLLASGTVESVEENFVCHATRATANESFGSAKASRDFGLTGDGDGYPGSYSARDATIAIIDTGIDPKHPDFAGGKIIAWKDFVNGRTQPYDDNGHGTHCASIAAGRVVNGVGGVAPDASLIGLKVLAAGGRGNAVDIAAAVDWCIENRTRYDIEVVSMSLGGNTSSDGTDVLSRAVNRAVQAGLVVCVAAGNEGPGAFTVSSPGAAAEAITVGNMIDTGKDGFALNSSSSRGPTADGRMKPELCGPGTQILAAQANTTGYLRLTGTSMATPYVAGVAALMFEANPTLSPRQVKQIMIETAVQFGPPGGNNEFGHGRLNGYAAIAKASGNVGTQPTGPDHLYARGYLQSAGQYHVWTVPVDDTRFPMAMTLIMWNTGTDFDLFVYDPEGTLVRKSEGTTRQETVLFRPQMTGTYKIVVKDFSGVGWYILDISAGSSLQ